MSIPKNVNPTSISNGIKIKNKFLPGTPGVYLMKDASGRIIYVGKASSLRARVGSYFFCLHQDKSNKKKRKAGILRSFSEGGSFAGAGQTRTLDGKTAELVSQVRTIDYIRTKTVLEALILEAAKIKQYKPKYNILQKDDKSFLYLVVTKEKFPKILLMRGHELKNFKFQISNFRFSRVFGPFVSPNALRAALNILRKIFPWSNCKPPQLSTLNSQLSTFKSCFDYHLKKCPGVCIGAISSKDYKKIIRGLILFFEGKKAKVLGEMKKQMMLASKAEDFERAATLRNRIYHLENIRDTSVLTRDIETRSNEDSGAINIYGRIEGYDISNISGTSPVGSMVVFSGGEPDKSQYRKFKIKTVKGANDVAMLREVLTRRFSHNVSEWPLPDIILIDGGWPQVNVARRVLEEYHLGIPIVGLAKGIDRKKDELILPKDNPEMTRVANQFKDILVAVRDEAHRFAISFYRCTHRRKLLA